MPVVLIIIILVIILILTSILVIPFHITLNFKSQGLEFKGYFQLTWMKIKILRREIPSEEEKGEEKKKEEREEEKKKSEWTLKRILKVLNLFLEALPHFEKIFYAILRSISIERFCLNLTLGLESPVDTAMLSGFFWSIASIVNTIPRVSIYMRPQFMKTTFDGHLEFELKLKLLWIVIESLKAFTKKPVRNLISEVRA